MAKLQIIDVKNVLKNGPYGRKFTDAQIGQAWKAVVANSKVDTKKRNEVGRLFSNIFSKEGKFLDEPKGAADQYIQPRSMPDFEAEGESWVELLGPQVAALLAPGGATTETRFTAELKQKLGEKVNPTTITQKEVSGEVLERIKKEYDDLVSRKWTSSEVHNLLDKMLPKFKKDVIRQIQEKTRNYMVINYLDKDKKGRPIIRVVPSAAAKLDLEGAGFKKWIRVEMRPRKNIDSTLKAQMRAEGKPFTLNMIQSFPIRFILTAGAEKFLEKSAVDVTAKVHESLGPKFIEKFIAYAIKEIKVKNLDGLTEIIRLARQFSGEEGGAYKVVSQIPEQKMGPISRKARAKATRQLGVAGDIQQTMSTTQLTAAVQRSVRRKMPKGPIGGPPLSTDILTYRSGRFLRSIVAEIKQNIITYYYDPIYIVHEASGRAPSKDIELSIRNIIKRNMSGQEFTITRRS